MLALRIYIYIIICTISSSSSPSSSSLQSLLATCVSYEWLPLFASIGERSQHCILCKQQINKHLTQIKYFGVALYSLTAQCLTICVVFCVSYCSSSPLLQHAACYHSMCLCSCTTYPVSVFSFQLRISLNKKWNQQGRSITQSIFIKSLRKEKLEKYTILYPMGKIIIFADENEAILFSTTSYFHDIGKSRETFPSLSKKSLEFGIKLLHLHRKKVQKYWRLSPKETTQSYKLYLKQIISACFSCSTK